MRRGETVDLLGDVKKSHGGVGRIEVFVRAVLEVIGKKYSLSGDALEELRKEFAIEYKKQMKNLEVGEDE
jgi:hypothetical protein